MRYFTPNKFYPQIKNNIRSFVTIFLKIQKLPVMVLCLKELPRRFLWCCCIFILFVNFLHFILLLFLDVLHPHFLFDIIPHPSVNYRQVYTHFIFSDQPIVEWFATLSFSTNPRSYYRKRYGFDSTCIYQGFPGSQQFFLDGCN